MDSLNDIILEVRKGVVNKGLTVKAGYHKVKLESKYTIDEIETCTSIFLWTQELFQTKSS